MSNCYRKFSMSPTGPTGPAQLKPVAAVDPGPDQYLVLVTCRDEKHQVELLTRFQREGLECKALLS
jgi:hypothetical protein